jgi:hypothetical protein
LSTCASINHTSNHSRTNLITRSSFFPLLDTPLSLQYSSSSARPDDDQLCTECLFTRFGADDSSSVLLVSVVALFGVVDAAGAATTAVFTSFVAASAGVEADNTKDYGSRSRND